MIKCPSGFVTSQRPYDPIEKPLQALEERRLSMGAALRSGLLKPLGKHPHSLPHMYLLQRLDDEDCKKPL
ncbi:hypothetical protein DY000_02004368 [Brassica cretica]|uniref:Uncharacterized protein n=1 Tax=Brassica cretica TaxID=69181 RepID=A0ABQ7CMQ8_BRACR|nr:hypothetical protein DY000_02004368 [Brassica cretica]